MNSLRKIHYLGPRMAKQRGVVLFIALVALVAMSLAAVALIRSVDTTTLIAGNLSFRRAATTAGDAGVEAAIAWLNATHQANVNLNVLTDDAHPFNQTHGTGGYTNPAYYSNYDPGVNLTDGTGITWSDSDSMLVTADDGGGNEIRYVIQRMCQTAGLHVGANSCVSSGVTQDTGNKTVALAQDICDGPGCPPPGQSTQLRVTSRTVGPRGTISYVQAFVF